VPATDFLLRSRFNRAGNFHRSLDTTRTPNPINRLLMRNGEATKPAGAISDGFVFSRIKSQGLPMVREKLDWNAPLASFENELSTPEESYAVTAK
jgi:hypothetical protein